MTAIVINIIPTLWSMPLMSPSDRLMQRVGRRDDMSSEDGIKQSMKAGSLSIVGCRTTDQGILLKFSDRQFYLYTNEFLIAGRAVNAEHIQSPSDWLTEKWKKKVRPTKDAS
jgi:hypothetical protein